MQQQIGLYIPAEIKYSQNLTPSEKMILSEIIGLSNETGYCYAKNEHFTPILSCSIHAISKHIAALAEKGYISVVYENPKNYTGRMIYPKQATKKQDADITPNSVTDADDVNAKPQTNGQSPEKSDKSVCENLKPRLRKTQSRIKNLYRIYIHTLYKREKKLKIEKNSNMIKLKINYDGFSEPEILNFETFFNGNDISPFEVAKESHPDIPQEVFEKYCSYFIKNATIEKKTYKDGQDFVRHFFNKLPYWLEKQKKEAQRQKESAPKKTGVMAAAEKIMNAPFAKDW